jgi:hypothetical protein
METPTEVMRRRVHRIGRQYRPGDHRRPVQPRPAASLVAPASTPEPVRASGAPEVRYESPLPHAAWITGGWLLALVAGLALGVGLAHHLAG